MLSSDGSITNAVFGDNRVEVRWVHCLSWHFTALGTRLALIFVSDVPI